jgi:hypothetical protein
MILVLSGEGPTDLGRCHQNIGQCQQSSPDGMQWNPGPLYMYRLALIPGFRCAASGLQWLSDIERIDLQ